MCADPGRCAGQDTHAGYEGALRCLVDSHGDVAWTKMSAVTKYFKIRTDVGHVYSTERLLLQFEDSHIVVIL